MDGWPTAKNKANATHGYTTGAPNTQLKCMQINLQHSRLATDNFLKTTAEEEADIICIKSHSKSEAKSEKYHVPAQY